MKDTHQAGITYRFTVLKPESQELMLSLLKLAMAETEVVFGKSQVKLETSVDVSGKKPQCTIEGGAESGEYLAKLFTGFLIKKFGEQGFRVMRLGVNPWKR